MKNLIRVLDSEDQVLFECSLEEEEKAYKFATQMEELGVEVRVSTPSAPETLATSLGMTHTEADDFRKSIIEEIEEHDTGCCFETDLTKDPDTPIQ